MRSRARGVYNRVRRDAWHATCEVFIEYLSAGARELRGEERGGDGGGDREDAGADVADILHTRGHIGILKFRKTPEDLRYLSLYRSFRILAVLSNPSFDAPHQA